ncbi:MAG TPA: SpoIIE family protein phosphatase [Bacteroidia bacterium]|jgi:PAS domain S-box-containing protein|nr:SpoIIE family protein phosphatase [Bacteroidia bacterium]
MVTLDIQEQILDKLNALIVVLNNDGSADYVSKSAQQLLGYRSNELLGNNWWEATRFSKPEGIEIKHKLLNLFKNGDASTQTFEHVLKTSYGGQKWVRWSVSYLNDEQLIGIGYDITEKKNSERKLIEQNEKLTEQNKDITASIVYAKRIQESILQTSEIIKNVFEGSFLLYKPKDIVSGDYYWVHEDENYKYAAAVDCTGHGVPGAMMSMVANSAFKEVFLNKKITEPGSILQALDEELEKALHKNSCEPFNDGMDVGLIQLKKANNELKFSGAFRSIIVAGKEGVIEIRGSRYPLGFYSGVEKRFDTITYQLQKNDCVYLYSDGYVDQFGGEHNKKLNKVNFKELIKTASEMGIDEQEAFLEYSFNNWKQDEEQTDDILVIGIKV